MNTKIPFRGCLFTLTTLMLLMLTWRTNAFSPIGPYTDWMVSSNGYREAEDIGGPMNLGEEYRWNVPTLTYGFDKSFTDYFGTNGEAAVESAIQILNDLPAASSIDLNNFPSDCRQVNSKASAQGVYDLKSTALSLLLEQMGLGQPARNVIGIKVWTPQLTTYPVCGSSDCPNLALLSYFVIQRNFDPLTLTPSFAVNGTGYGATIQTWYGTTVQTDGVFNDYMEFPLDPSSSPYSAVADGFSFEYSGLHAGTFYTNLTKDDAGGLAYLLRSTNVNWESLPANVLFLGHHRSANRKLRGAWRPGVEKINFVPQPRNNRGKFKTAVFKYTASYVTNGVVTEQSVKRVVSQPDIVFSAVDTSGEGSPMFLRTGTDAWINNAAQNGDSTAAGPGVITSPVQITFDKTGAMVFSGDSQATSVMNNGWASFDQSTNPPVLYPPNTGQTNLAVRLQYYLASGESYTNFNNTLFNVPVAFGSPATLQTSTNNTDWISLITITNNGSIVQWNYYGHPVAISFRVMPGAQ
jgi:hypothetical protein